MNEHIRITEGDKQDAIAEMELEGVVSEIIDRIKQEDPALFAAIAAPFYAEFDAEVEAGVFVAKEGTVQ